MSAKRGGLGTNLDSLIPKSLTVAGNEVAQQNEVLIDDISADSYAYSMERLFVLGLLDSNMIPSPIGLACTKFRIIELENILLILNGYVNDCNIQDMITMAAFASVGISSYINRKDRKYNYTDISCGTSMYPHDEIIEPIFIWDSFVKKIEMDVVIEATTG